MGSWTGRSIVYDPAFEREIERLGIDYERLDEALTGIEWGMSNSPEVFPEVYGSKLRMAKTIPAPSLPALRIWFTFNETTVTIVFGELSQDDED